MLQGQNLLDGAQGTVYITIEGQRYLGAHVKSVSAEVEFNKTESRALGRRMGINRITGGSGTGTLTLYYMSSLFREALLNWKTKGAQPYFQLIATNDDVGSTAGRQTVVLEGCLPDTIPLTLLDAEGEEMEEELPFTFDDFDIPEKFNNPNWM